MTSTHLDHKVKALSHQGVGFRIQKKNGPFQDRFTTQACAGCVADLPTSNQIAHFYRKRYIQWWRSWMRPY
jgi:hypothetical protein